MSTALGYSIMVDVYDCIKFPINKEEILEHTKEVLKIAGLHAVKTDCCEFPVEEYAHMGGISAFSIVIKLEESHFAIHTWPERCFLSIDLFTCGDLRAARSAVNLFLDKIEALDYNVSIRERGKADCLKFKRVA